MNQPNLMYCQGVGHLAGIALFHHCCNPKNLILLWWLILGLFFVRFCLFSFVFVFEKKKNEKTGNRNPKYKKKCRYFSDNFKLCLDSYNIRYDELQAQSIGDTVSIARIKDALSRKKYTLLALTHVIFVIFSFFCFLLFFEKKTYHTHTINIG